MSLPHPHKFFWNFYLVNILYLRECAKNWPFEMRKGRVGVGRQVGSDKERPKGRVGSGSDNGEVGSIPMPYITTVQQQRIQ